MCIATSPAHPEDTNPSDVAARSRTALLAVLAVLCATCVLALAEAGMNAPALWAAPVVVALVMLGELTSVPPGARADRWAPSAFDVTLATGLALAPGGWLALSLAAGAVTSRLIKGERGIKAALSAAVILASASVASAIAVAIPGHSVAPVAGIAAGWVIWSAAHSVIALISRDSILTQLRREAPTRLSRLALSTSFGLLLAHTVLTSPAFAVCLALPAIALISGLFDRRRRQDEIDLFDQLLVSQHSRAHVGRIDPGRSLLLAAEGLIGIAGADVQVFLCPPARRWKLVSHVGGEIMQTSPTAHEASRMLAAFTSGEQVRVESTAAGSTLTAVTHVDGKPAAVVLATWEGKTPASSRHRIERLATMLVTHASDWLADTPWTTSGSQTLNLMPTQRQRAADELHEAAQTIASLTSDTGDVDPELIGRQIRALSAALARLHGDVAAPHRHTATPARPGHHGERVRVGTLHARTPA